MQAGREPELKLAINLDWVLNRLTSSENEVLRELARSSIDFPYFFIDTPEGLKDNTGLSLRFHEFDLLRRAIPDGRAVLCVRMHEMRYGDISLPQLSLPPESEQSEVSLVPSSGAQEGEFFYDRPVVGEALRVLRAEGQVPRNLPIVSLVQDGWVINCGQFDEIAATNALATPELGAATLPRLSN